MILLNLIFAVSVWAHSTPPIETTVVVIGAGAAGLHAADILRQSEIPHFILESEPRAGGRVSSRPDRWGRMGLILDDGANLINSTDTNVLRLLHRFQIPYVKRQKTGSDRFNYVIGESHLTQNQAQAWLFETNQSVLEKIERDAHELERENPLLEFQFTHQSILDYLNSAKATPDFVKLMHSFFWSEYGRTLDQLNVHVLHDYFEVNSETKTFMFISHHDEAIAVPGGNGQIIDRLVELNRDALLLSHRVTRIEFTADERVRVVATSTQGEKEFLTRHVEFAAPLHSLKHIKVQIPGLSPGVLREASSVAFGRGVKLHLKFKAPFRDEYPHGGLLLTDTGEQIWVSSVGQKGNSGLLTVLTGPFSHRFGELEKKVAEVLKQLEKVSPGVSRLFVEAERVDAPFSYSGAYALGERPWPEIHQLDSKYWTTIGEASSEEQQGYFEGALESGFNKTSRLVSRLKAPCLKLLNP